MRRPHEPKPRSPWVVEHRAHESHRGRSLDLQVRLAFSADGDEDAETLRLQALRELKRMVAALEEGQWARHARLSGGKVVKGEGTPTEGPYHLPPREKRPPRPKVRWQAPDLPPLELQTCHEILHGLLMLGVHGKAVPVGELQRQRAIPQKRFHRVLDPDSRAYAYLRPYIQEMRSHGKRLLDLTAEGRQLASMIRAGEVPLAAR